MDFAAVVGIAVFELAFVASAELRHAVPTFISATATRRLAGFVRARDSSGGVSFRIRLPLRYFWLPPQNQTTRANSGLSLHRPRGPCRPICRQTKPLGHLNPCCPAFR